MNFKKVLFGYAPSEVALCIEGLQAELDSSRKQVQSLAQENRRLEYINDELKMKVSIYEEVFRGRKSSGGSSLPIQSSPKE